MNDEQYRREYAEHLIESVKNGTITRRELLIRASVFGFSATVAGRLLASLPGTTGGRGRTDPRRGRDARPSAAGGTLRPSSRRRSRRSTRSPSTTRAASCSPTSSAST